MCVSEFQPTKFDRVRLLLSLDRWAKLCFFISNADLQKIFNDADDDSSGSIDKKEFKKLAKKMNIYPGDKEFDTLFKEVDSDGIGFVIVFLSFDVVFIFNPLTFLKWRFFAYVSFNLTL